ncbi:glycoside hydrolase, clan GH-D [Tanticharoenia sakaeratensis NBRC 103193]|uniref:alpha-galactosidase n=1 Tax=Tanticharoenia sakaeratensis NBRC 103193 TaxID=1231623 RepID=A0A0D6MPZ0_9PROT|nr:glycoside hydrolase, clan GH-D [Tanticharoenia sakaeratensis NBRC 103193]
MGLAGAAGLAGRATGAAAVIATSDSDASESASVGVSGAPFEAGSGAATAPVIPGIEAAGEGSSAPMRLLRLDGTRATLLLIARHTGLPEIAHWGARLPDDLDAQSVFAMRAPEMPDNGPDQWQPLITLLDTIGGWSLDMPGLIASRPDGTAWTAAFTITAIDHTPGQLTLQATDDLSRLRLDITLTLGTEDVLSAQTVLTNTGETPLDVARLVSGTFLLPDTMTTFGVMHGAWGMEWGQSPTELRNGALVIESRRNRSHDHFPGLVAGATGTTQNTGEAYGAQLGWSGGHRFCVERMEDARYRLSVSEYLYPGEGSLPPGAALKTPVAYAAFSPQGYAGIARAFQAFARAHVLQWPGGAMKPRPVLLNSWEGNLFDLHEDCLRRQIDATADLGVERFVLDDGWFGSRRNDRQGLGDWTVARSIFPQGLRPLSDHVHARGMQFGLWYEPEMANPDSNVFRAHPDWALQVRGRPLLTSRRQVALDISRPEVADHLFTTLSHEVTNSRIDYIKWDFNRDLLDAADAQGRAAYRRQVLALYALWDRLHHAHPELEIESCASGGGRHLRASGHRAEPAETHRCRTHAPARLDRAPQTPAWRAASWRGPVRGRRPGSDRARRHLDGPADGHLSSGAGKLAAGAAFGTGQALRPRHGVSLSRDDPETPDRPRRPTVTRTDAPLRGWPCPVRRGPHGHGALPPRPCAADGVCDRVPGGAERLMRCKRPHYRRMPPSASPTRQ